MPAPCWRLAAIDESGRRRRSSRAAGPSPSARCRSYPAAPAELIVPAVVVGKGDDGTPVGHHHRRRRRARSTAPARHRPAAAELLRDRARQSTRRWLPDAVVAAPRRGRAPAGSTKVVLAREIVVEADVPIDRHGVLHRLRGGFGSSYRFAVDGFVGAQPELLVGAHGAHVRRIRWPAPRPHRRSEPRRRLAADLIACTKNQVEHRITIDMVHDTLLPWCSYLDYEPEPSIVRRGQRPAPRHPRRGSAVGAAAATCSSSCAALHPTPALGGRPATRPRSR